MKTLTRTPGEAFGTGNDFPALDLRALDEELATISDDELEASIVGCKQQMDSLHAQWLMRIAEYDRRQLADLRHRLTTTGWLRFALRLAGRTASSAVRQARGLVRMPEVAEKAVDGSITPDAVQLLDRARRRHPDEFAIHAHVFADIATYLDPSEFRQAIGHWEQQIDYPDAVTKARAQRVRRRFSINQTFDGMWSLSGELDPETGSLVNSAISSLADKANIDASDTRAPWQARADALAFVCEQWLRNGPTSSSGGTKPHLNVTIDAEALLGLRKSLGTIDSVSVPPETIDRIMCDASVVRIVLDENKTPIDVGRATRTISPALRRALEFRDNHCQWTGCFAPAGWCDAHHIRTWSSMGETNLDNLTLLCRTHHTATHDAMALESELSESCIPP